MADGDHEAGVGPPRIILDPIETGLHARRRSEQPQRLINKVTAKITKQAALMPSLEGCRIVLVEAGVKSPHLTELLIKKVRGRS